MTKDELKALCKYSKTHFYWRSWIGDIAKAPGYNKQPLAVATVRCLADDYRRDRCGQTYGPLLYNHQEQEIAKKLVEISVSGQKT